MVWKEATDTALGNASTYGAPDIKKYSQLLNGVVDVDINNINSQFIIRDGKLQHRNPANTFSYIVITSDIAANRNVTEPLLLADDTRVYANHIQTLVGKTLTSPILTTPTINGVTIGDATDIALSITTGTKIGTAIDQKLAFFNATPVIQRTGITNVDVSVVDGTYGAEEQAVIESLRTKLNAVIQVLEDLGITAVV